MISACKHIILRVNNKRIIDSVGMGRGGWGVEQELPIYLMPDQ